MKMVGIIMLVLAVIILLVGIISPLNIFICALFAGVFFLLGGIISTSKNDNFLIAFMLCSFYSCAYYRDTCADTIAWFSTVSRV